MSTREEALGAGASAVTTKRLLTGTLVFVLLFAVGLFLVKWSPYGTRRTSRP